MGNKLGRKHVVDEKYTRPQGLYQHKYVDQKKLRKLILDAKLAPCYPGDDECGCELEECPICFLNYPSLNRSRCCMKGICTECFLQMKTPNSTQPTHYGRCPFCKTSNYAVEYRGVKTKEEKGLEQIEEQRVIEAKIRMRHQELQENEERVLKRTEISSSNSMSRPSGVDYCSTRAPSISSAVRSEEIGASHVQSAASTIRLPLRQRQNREDDFDLDLEDDLDLDLEDDFDLDLEDDFDLDLEDIMVMEAIWLSIQENGRCQAPPYSDAPHSEQYMVEDHSSLSLTASIAGSSTSSSSPSSGLACAIAAPAERQLTSGETSNYYGAGTSNYSVPGSSRFSHHEEHEPGTYFPAETAIVASPDNSQLIMTGDAGQWVDHRSSEVEAGYEGSNEFHDATQVDIQCSSFQPVVGPIVPDSYEEQVMLAMAVSLAEGRARNGPPGVACQ